MKKLSYIALSVLIGLGASQKPAMAEADPQLGDLQLTGINFCPRGWGEANGALLPINQYDALFSLLGTQFGGDGRTTFALPDLRGRIPVGRGTGPGLSPYSAGLMGGQELVAMPLPSHTHTAVSTGTSALNVTDDVVNVHLPGGARLGVGANPTGSNFASAGAFDQTFEAGSVTTTVSTTIADTGGGQLQGNMQPFQGLRFCMALQGTFPSRN